jgi:outer membrane lipopolysaccharide assembly protein LptE/RlpB
MSWRIDRDKPVKRTTSLLLLLAALASTSCGYALAGRGSTLPESIRTIGVPVFGNQTPYFEVAAVLTQSVRTELIGRGKYKVLPQDTGVDAVLKAEVTSLSLTPSGFNENQQATRYAATVVVSIQLVQASDNKVLWQNPSQVFREEYAVTSGDTAQLDPNAFFGQSSNAVQRMASDFARSVVGAILEAF